MSKTIIYSCVFFNQKYINLINLLLKSYKLFGNSPYDVDYLIICNHEFQNSIQKIFDDLNINGKIWCLDVKNIFEAGYSRLKIFDYPDINLYNKILYLDCDILITNSINNILDFQLENKLYALKENCNRINHCEVFTDEEYRLLDKNSAFSSGILLFNNSIIIKDLFSQILLHINNHITSKLDIPICLDQPFIVYHAVKNNLYNNQKLINIVINNPNNFNNETISHFPGGPGHYESKIIKMTKFMNNVMFNVTNKAVIPEIIPDNFVQIVSEIHKDTSINTKKYVNIHEDIWTCSDEFREGIKYFFKDKSHYKIAEIGSHKGYTTGYLSNIFEKIYAVDNSVEWTNFNKNLNKDKNNIEYIHLDIYKDTWDIIPDVDVVFIDAGHSYEKCKSDMYNSIKNFKNLKYIIFDDYGMWPGVKETVNESLNNNILIFEKYIGLNNVPGPNNKVVKNTSEGIICRVNKLLNKKYIWENSNIEFLKNYKMNAFGLSNYSFIDKYLVKCDFGGAEHLLKFNENYSKFISIRKYNFGIVAGEHL